MSIDITQCRKFSARALIPALTLLMLLGAGCSEKETASTQEVAPAQAQAPAPKVAEAPAADKPDDTQPAVADGRMIYQTYCRACHLSGVAGAPKQGDKEAWAPRIEKGVDVLFSSVKNGLNAMPPQGACARCTDDQLQSAVEYLVQQGS